MTSRIDAFRHKVEVGMHTWRANVTLDYISAYATAYKNFEDTIKKQADSDKARAEMFVTAASIVTGSILMATVASASMRVVAGNAALNVICRYNLNRTFDLMATAASSQTFMFAVGKVLDTAKDKLNSQIKETVTKLTDTTSKIISSAPIVQHVHLEKFMEQHWLCCNSVADLIEGAPISEAAKVASFAVLEKAPMVNPPTRGIDAVKLAEKIELCFYMKLVLDSDELIDWPYRSNFDQSPGTVGAVSHPIPQLPSASDYPKPKPPQFGFLGTSAHQSIGVSRPGSDIRAKVDELSRKVLGHAFYASGDIFGDVSGPEKMAELSRAEQVINRLAQATRPAWLADVKS